MGRCTMELMKYTVGCEGLCPWGEESGCVQISGMDNLTIHHRALTHFSLNLAYVRPPWSSGTTLQSLKSDKMLYAVIAVFTVRILTGGQ